MASSNFFAFSLFSAILSLLSPAMLATNSNLFREYIGASYNGVKFSDVPINSGVQFHFILAFAIDYTTSTSPPSPTDGNFEKYWDTTNLSPSDVAAIKQNYSNVKVAVSLGGATISGDPVYFNITSIDSWVSNAVSSLTSIIQGYGLDGIDVDYENFQADNETFAECIGQLITRLKSNGVISFASIAPYGYDDSEVQSHYQALWGKYGSVIDYVNFQFYAFDSSTTEAQYISYYNRQTSNYPGGNILTSFSTGGGNTVAPDTALNASSSLQAQGQLYGIFVWSADNSKSEGFEYEIKAQQLLAGA